jgi:phosphate-selective porin OprO/OprP
MRSKLLGYAVSAAAAGVLSINAAAGTVTSDGQDIVIKTKGGFEAKTADDAFTFKIGGRVQVQYDTYKDAMNLLAGDGDSGSDLFFRRARIYLKGTMYDNWAYKIQFNLVDDGDGGGTAEDLYIRWKGAKWANITVGKHKEPLSLQELTSSKWVTTVERAAIVDFFAEGRSLGISVGGANDFGGYQIGVFDAARNEGANRQLWATTGRVHLSPINSERALFHIGLGATHRDVDNTDFDGGGEITQGIKKGDKLTVGFAGDGTEGEKRNAINLELAGKAGPFHAQAEANWRKTTLETPDANIDVSDTTNSGWYVQAGGFLTGESRIYKKGTWDKVKPNNKKLGAWEVFARAEGLNFDNSGISDATRNKGNIYNLGVNWYPNDILRISANYVQSSWKYDLADNEGDLVRADSIDAFSGISKKTGRGFAVRMQAAF